MRTLLKLFLAVLLLTAMAQAGLTLSSPSNGATVGTSVHFVAAASSGYPISAIRIYIDNANLYTAASAGVDTYLTLAPGSHYIVVQAWDQSGALFRQTATINVVPASGGGVTVTAPANGATVGSPLNVVASAASAHPVTAMRVYVDGTSLFAVSAASLNASLSLAVGPHNLVVQAWDSTGAVFKSSLNVTVASAYPANATVIGQIEQMAGWQSCSACAGIGGTGPVAPYSMGQGVSSPSRDGSSAQFNLAGNIPYSNALWWKQLGANANATHFVYDLYFYLTQPQLAQALEFDVNQSVGGFKYIFGVQCDLRGSGQWDVWDGMASAWTNTGAACPALAANTWHHLTEEFQRDASGAATFIAITLNGVRYPINRTYHSIQSSANEINVAFQMDGDYAQHPFSVWLDQVTLAYW